MNQVFTTFTTAEILWLQTMQAEVSLLIILTVKFGMILPEPRGCILIVHFTVTSREPAGTLC